MPREFHHAAVRLETRLRADAAEVPLTTAPPAETIRHRAWPRVAVGAAALAAAVIVVAAVAAQA